MVHLLLSPLLLAAYAYAAQSTRTEVRCRTSMGTFSPYAVPTHTTTFFTDARPVTVAFTSREISTMKVDQIMTFNKTETTISTTTETTTTKLTGSIFTTTSTQVVWDALYVNLTTTMRARNMTTESFTVTMQMPTINGFVPVNTSTTNVSSSTTTTAHAWISTLSDGSLTTIQPPSDTVSSSAGDVTDGASSSERIVYILSDGHLVPTPLTAVTALISEPQGTPTPAAVPGSQSPSATSSYSMSSPSPTPKSNEPDFIEVDPDEADPEPAPETTITSSISGTIVMMSLATPKSLAAFDPATVMKQAEPSPTLARRDVEPREVPKQTIIRLPKSYKGLRGAIADEPAITDQPHPTAVHCTKSLIRESTIWAPAVDPAPSFVAPQPIINIVTSISTLTVTKTVPDRSPFRTDSFVSRTTLTTTTTFAHTKTMVEEIVFTVSSTSTAFAACETQNLLGPTAYNETHIVNVYNRGAGNYSSFMIGHSNYAEGCCVECHTLEIPCLGSVYADGRCYLFTDEGSQCTSQGSAAAYFVGRSGDERSPRRQRLKWPEYTVSNGPCGFFYDGGIGW